MADTGVLADTRAIVVGGSSGIGLATARLLAADGCRVTIAGRDEARLTGAVVGLAAEGLEVHPVRCDTLVASDVARAVEVACEGDRLDIAVTVPGGGTPMNVLDYEPEQFSAEVDKNVFPVFTLLKYAGERMTAGGSFVAVSSTAAVFSTRGLASYRAGKAAVDALVDVAADELGERGIRVNSVRPGLTRTESTTGIFANHALLARFLEQQAIPRGGEAVDIGAAIRFLAGPESSWITGQHLTVDGGHTLRAMPDMRPPAKG
jgi:NAD(P)-dependent dehydrogenase (short-subunit alcohol dehydrogenase family)